MPDKPLEETDDEFSESNELVEETVVQVEAEGKDDEPSEKLGAEVTEEVTEEELRTYSKSVQKRINSLTSKHHAERRGKEAAEGERNEAANLAKHLVDENNKLKNLLNKGEHVLVGEAKSRLSSELKSTQTALTAALEAGDSEATAAAQSELARVMAQTERVNSYQPQQLEPAQYVEPARPAPKPDPKADDWRSKNRWFGKDEEMTAFAMGLHQRLVNKDYLSPDSDEYYEEIDSNLRQRFPERFKSNRRATKTIVAPAQRSSTRTRSVTLNESQVRLATRLGITPEDYAAEYIKEYPDG